MSKSANTNENRNVSNIAQPQQSSNANLFDAPKVERAMDQMQMADDADEAEDYGEEEAEVVDNAFGNSDQADRFKQDDDLAHDLYQNMRNN